MSERTCYALDDLFHPKGRAGEGWINVEAGEVDDGDSKKDFEGVAQSCSWKAKLPKVTPKIRKPTRVMMRSFPRRAQDFLSSRMSSIRFEGLLRRPSKR